MTVINDTEETDVGLEKIINELLSTNGTMQDDRLGVIVYLCNIVNIDTVYKACVYIITNNYTVNDYDIVITKLRDKLAQIEATDEQTRVYGEKLLIEAIRNSIDLNKLVYLVSSGLTYTTELLFFVIPRINIDDMVFSCILTNYDKNIDKDTYLKLLDLCVKERKFGRIKIIVDDIISKFGIAAIYAYLSVLGQQVTPKGLLVKETIIQRVLEHNTIILKRSRSKPDMTSGVKTEEVPNWKV